MRWFWIALLALTPLAARAVETVPMPDGAPVGGGLPVVVTPSRDVVTLPEGPRPEAAPDKGTTIVEGDQREVYYVNGGWGFYDTHRRFHRLPAGVPLGFGAIAARPRPLPVVVTPAPVPAGPMIPVAGPMRPFH